MRARLSVATVICLTLVVILAFSGVVRAAQYDLHAGDSIAQILPSLQPGDTVVLHSGTYGRVWIEDLHGTADGWITFKGAEGEARPLINYPGGDKNVIDLNGVSYLRFQYLEVTGGGDGFKFGYGSTNHDVIMEDLKVHAVGNVAINASSIVELSNLTVRRCELYHTGWVQGGHGEGLYLGVASGSYQPQVHDSLIEQNYIHDLGGSHGDGIEIKHGSYNVVVQDNVLSVHKTCPSITVWGTYKNDPAYNNIVRRNFIWRPVDAGIQATGETTIENNVIIGSVHRGLSIRNRDDGVMQYMRIVNNTIYRAEGDAAVSLYYWDAVNGGPGLIFANNAVFQDMPEKVAVKAFSGLEKGIFSSNLIVGTITLPGAVSGLIAANPANQQFINTSIYPGQMNYYLLTSSQLIDAADPLYAAWGDFNLQKRPFGAACDIGAYEWSQSANPGWGLTMGFKDMNAVPPQPSPVLSVNPTDGISLRAWPGQFTLPVSRTYTLTNTGPVVLEWSASCLAPWATVSGSGGTLGPAESTSVTITLTEAVDALSAGHYSEPLRFTNTLSGEGSKAIPIEVVALSPAQLAITPETGFGGMKMIGGYMMPYCQYQVTNTGDFPMDWTASADQPWVSFTTESGTLQPQASETLYAYVNYLSNQLAVGSYAATITFDGSASSAGVKTVPVALEMTWMGDINSDRAVDVEDLMLLAGSWSTTYMDARYDMACDLDADGAVDVMDLLMLAENWGKGVE